METDKIETLKFDVELDARGLLCPLPVLKLRKRLSPMVADQIIYVVTDDPAAIVDVPHFCNEQGHILLKVENTGEHCKFFIKKA